MMPWTFEVVNLRREPRRGGLPKVHAGDSERTAEQLPRHACLAAGIPRAAVHPYEEHIGRGPGRQVEIEGERRVVDRGVDDVLDIARGLRVQRRQPRPNRQPRHDQRRGETVTDVEWRHQLRRAGDQ
jgi:hypothetical protein